MDDLRALLIERGAALVGWADLAALPPDVRAGLPRGVAIAVALDRTIVRAIGGGPTKEYFAEYVRVNGLLDDLAAAAAAWLQARGHRAEARAATLARLDPQALRTPLPHKTVATRAGLGWVGKCALLVTEAFGSAVRLATVLTGAPLAVGRPVDESRCGACAACVEVCPDGAPSGREWHAGMAREELFDAAACYAAARRMCREAGIGGMVCGMCIAACPWTQGYLGRAAAPP